MRWRVVGSGFAVALAACGGAPSPPPGAGSATSHGSSTAATAASPDAAAASPDAWTLQAGSLTGIDKDAGACVRAASWDSAEEWAKSIRMPKEDAPAKGAETGAAELARLDVSGDPKRSARAYLQTVRYPLAGEVERRRIVAVETTDGRVSACVVSELVGKEPDDDAEPLRWIPHGERVIELTYAPQPDERGMIDLVATRRSSRHLCDVGGGFLGCVTLQAGAEIKLMGADVWYESRQIMLEGRRGPFLLAFRAGASAIVDDGSANRVLAPRGRAMASGVEHRVVIDPARPRVDPAELAPFQDHGACVTIAAKTTASPHGEGVGLDRDISIVDPTPARWVESFRPEERSAARARSLGALGGVRPVETIELGGASLDEVASGFFVFVAEPERIAGCALHVGKPRYGVVEDSYRELSEGRFSFLLQRQPGMSLGGRRVEEQRFVLCKLVDHRLGCISAPSRWHVAEQALAVTDMGDRAEVPPSRAQIDTDEGGFRWTPPFGTSFRLALQPGKVLNVPPPAGPGHPGDPAPLEARATLRSP